MEARRVRTAEERDSFVWIHFDPDAPSLAEFLGLVADRMAAYRLQDYALTQDQTCEVDCNWKVAADAFNEAYHLRAVHPQLMQLVDET